MDAAVDDVNPPPPSSSSLDDSGSYRGFSAQSSTIRTIACNTAMATLPEAASGGSSPVKPPAGVIIDKSVDYGKGMCTLDRAEYLKLLGVSSHVEDIKPAPVESSPVESTLVETSPVDKSTQIETYTMGRAEYMKLLEAYSQIKDVKPLSVESTPLNTLPGELSPVKSSPVETSAQDGASAALSSAEQPPKDYESKEKKEGSSRSCAM
jgi:hypothetical protein